MKVKLAFIDYVDDKAKAMFGFLFCNIFQKLINFICMPFYTRLLNAEQYGEYSLYQSWTSIIMVFLTLNLFYSGYVSGLAHFSKEEERYTSATIGLVTGLCLLGGVVVWTINDITHVVLPRRYVVYMIFEVFLNALYFFWAANERFHYRFVNLLKYTVVALMTSSMAGITALYFVEDKYKLDIRILTTIIGWFIVDVLGYRKWIFNIQYLLVKKYWIYGLSTNIPLIPHYLSGVILNQSDRIMIEYYSGKRYTAYYSLAYSISMMLTLFTTALKNTLDPMVYQSLKENDSRKLVTIIDRSFLFIGCFCITSTLVAPELIQILAPDDYSLACSVLPPLTCSVFFIYSYNMFSAIEFYYRKSKTMMVVSAIVALLNLVLNLIFVPVYGFSAAGYTTLFCYIMFAVLHLVISQYVIHKERISNMFIIPRYIIYAITVVILCNLISLLYSYSFVRIIILVIMLSVLFVKRKYFLSIIMKEK